MCSPNDDVPSNKATAADSIAPTPGGKSACKEGRRISFAPRVAQTDVIGLCDMDETEKANYWWSQDELKGICEATRILIEGNKGNSNYDLLDVSFMLAQDNSTQLTLETHLQHALQHPGNFTAALEKWYCAGGQIEEYSGIERWVSEYQQKNRRPAETKANGVVLYMSSNRLSNGDVSNVYNIMSRTSQLYGRMVGHALYRAIYESDRAVRQPVREASNRRLQAASNSPRGVDQVYQQEAQWQRTIPVSIFQPVKPPLVKSNSSHSVVHVPLPGRKGVTRTRSEDCTIPVIVQKGLVRSKSIRPVVHAPIQERQALTKARSEDASVHVPDRRGVARSKSSISDKPVLAPRRKGVTRTRSEDCTIPVIVKKGLVRSKSIHPVVHAPIKERITSTRTRSDDSSVPVPVRKGVSRSTSSRSIEPAPEVKNSALSRIQSADHIMHRHRRVPTTPSSNQNAEWSAVPAVPLAHSLKNAGTRSGESSVPLPVRKGVSRSTSSRSIEPAPEVKNSALSRIQSADHIMHRHRRVPATPSSNQNAEWSAVPAVPLAHSMMNAGPRPDDSSVPVPVRKGVARAKSSRSIEPAPVAKSSALSRIQSADHIMHRPTRVPTTPSSNHNADWWAATAPAVPLAHSMKKTNWSGSAESPPPMEEKTGWMRMLRREAKPVPTNVAF